MDRAERKSLGGFRRQIALGPKANRGPDNLMTDARLGTTSVAWVSVGNDRTIVHIYTATTNKRVMG